MVMEKLIQRFNTSPSTKKKINTFRPSSHPESCEKISKTCFGESLEKLCARDRREIPLVVCHICSFLISNSGLTTEGIFRVSGNSRAIEYLKNTANEQYSSVFQSSSDFHCELERIGDVHSAACLLKLFLRDLPDSLISSHFTKELIKLYDLHSENSASLVNNMKDLLNHLPRSNFLLLQYICCFLWNIAQNQSQNRMSSVSLGIIFGPNIFKCPPESESITNQSKLNSVMSILIGQAHSFFNAEISQLFGSANSSHETSFPLNDKEGDTLSTTMSVKKTNENSFSPQPKRRTSVHPNNGRLNLELKILPQCLNSCNSCGFGDGDLLPVSPSDNDFLIPRSEGDVRLSPAMKISIRNCIERYAFASLAQIYTSFPNCAGSYSSTADSNFIVVDQPRTRTPLIIDGQNQYTRPNQMNHCVLDSCGGISRCRNFSVSDCRSIISKRDYEEGFSSSSKNDFKINEILDTKKASASIEASGKVLDSPEMQFPDNDCFKETPYAFPSEALEKTYPLLVAKLSRRRELVGRPEDINEMTLIEVEAEKIALQKTLLSFESNHGRPNEHRDRVIMRPLYDRYRYVKQLIIHVSRQNIENRNLKVKELRIDSQCAVGFFPTSVTDVKTDSSTTTHSSIKFNEFTDDHCSNVAPTSKFFSEECSKMEYSTHPELMSTPILPLPTPLPNNRKNCGGPTHLDEFANNSPVENLHTFESQLRPIDAYHSSVISSCSHKPSPVTSSDTIRLPNTESVPSPNDDDEEDSSQTPVAELLSRPPPLTLETRTWSSSSDQLSGFRNEISHPDSQSNSDQVKKSSQLQTVTSPSSGPEIQLEYVIFSSLPAAVNCESRSKCPESSTSINTTLHTMQNICYSDKSEEEVITLCNNLSFTELQTAVAATRDRKKKLQKILKDFEHTFQRKNGRRIEPNDRLPMQVEYSNYKIIKTRLIYLENVVAAKSTDV